MLTGEDVGQGKDREALSGPDRWVSVSHTHTCTQTHTLGGQGSPGKAPVTIRPSVLLHSRVKTESGAETQEGSRSAEREKKMKF